MRLHGMCLPKQFVLVACLGLGVGLNAIAHDDEEQGDGVPPGPSFSPAFSFDGKRLLTVHGNVAYLWDVGTGKEIQRFEGHADPVLAVTFSPDGKYLLTGGGRTAEVGTLPEDNTARLWDIASGKEIRRFEGHTAFVRAIQFSPDAKRILTAGRDSTARVWNVETGRQLFVIDGVSQSRAATFSPDGRHLVALVRQRIEVLDATTGNRICVIERDERDRRNRGFFNDAEFSPDGKRVVTASGGGIARTWDATTGRLLQIFEGHTSYVHQAAFTSNGERVITASADGTARLWDAETGDEIRRFQNPGPVRQFLVSGDGERFFAKWSVGDFYTPSGASLWDVDSGQEITRITEHVEWIVGFSPDSKTFLLVKSGRPASFWSAETGEMIREYE